MQPGRCEHVTVAGAARYLLGGCMLAAVLLFPVQGHTTDKFRDFKLRNLAGDTVRFDDVRGDVTLIAFFFPTCPYCNKALPITVKLFEKYRGQGLAMAWINVVEEEEDAVPGWLAGNGYEGITVLVGASQQYLARRYDIMFTPEHLILDPDRVILYRQRGYEAGYENELEDHIRLALDLQAAQ